MMEIGSLVCKYMSLYIEMEFLINVLKLIVVIIVQLCEYNKNH